MRKSAEKLDFEKAAELRNMLEDLRRTTKPMRRFTRHSLAERDRSNRAMCKHWPTHCNSRVSRR